MTIDESTLREQAAAEDQAHLFQFWDGLDSAARARLLAQVAELDWSTIAHLRELLRSDSGAQSAPAFEAPDLFPLHRTGEHEVRASQAVMIGEERLCAGLIGYVLVAGGQGSHRHRQVFGGVRVELAQREGSR